MRRALAMAVLGAALTAAASAQTLDKELVVTLSGPSMEGAIVSELLWDGGLLIIQSAHRQADDKLIPRYFAAPGPNMQLRRLAAMPPAAERYWKLKASRVSPTRLGTIDVRTDTQT